MIESTPKTTSGATAALAMRDESRGNTGHLGRSAGRHCQRLSLPPRWRPPPVTGPEVGETRRATFGQAMKIDGGSSWRICWRSLTAARISFGGGLPQPIQHLVGGDVARLADARVERRVRPRQRSAAGSLNQHRSKSPASRRSPISGWQGHELGSTPIWYSCFCSTSAIFRTAECSRQSGTRGGAGSASAPACPASS